MKWFTTFCLSIIFPVSAFAANLTVDAITGKWLFTRIVMEDREIPVNRFVEFRPDGTAVMYVSKGVNETDASFRIEENTIIYTDGKGAQNWVVVALEENVLHVDHQGAQMFFEKQR